VTGIGRREHITPVVFCDSCTGCRFVNVFTLATLVYRSLIGTAPAYLSDDCRLTSSVGARSLYAPATPGHVFLVALTTTLELGVLPLPVLFRLGLLVLKLY